MNTPKLVRKETSKQHDFQFSAGYYLGGRHLPENLLICCLLNWGVYVLIWIFRQVCSLLELAANFKRSGQLLVLCSDLTRFNGLLSRSYRCCVPSNINAIAY
jgi:hypothetical protein